MLTSYSKRSFLRKTSETLARVLITPFLYTFLGLGACQSKEILQASPKGSSNNANGDPPLGSLRKKLDPLSAGAMKLSYVENPGIIVDPDLRRVRQGIEFNEQTCLNCLFYTDDGQVDGAEVGRCRVLDNQLVLQKGWCKSWAKKMF